MVGNNALRLTAYVSDLVSLVEKEVFDSPPA